MEVQISPRIDGAEDVFEIPEPLMGVKALEEWNKPMEFAPVAGLDDIFAGQPVATLVETPQSEQNQQAYLISAVCDDLKSLLLRKNEAYGGAAFVDVTLAGKTVDAETAILVRMGDKIRRLTKGHSFEDENDVQDLMGYCVLLLAVRKGKSK